MNPVIKHSLVALTAFGAMTALAVASVSAAGPGRGGGKFFERLDSNGDGGIERSEAEVAWARAFDRMDADGDGYISREEADSLRQRWRDRRPQRGERFGRQLPERGGERNGEAFAKSDSDGDGRISRDEFYASRADRLSAMDANGDGIVTRDEMGARRSGRGPGPQ